MSAGGDQQDIRGPLGTVPDDETPEGWCRVTCVIPDLKVKKKFSGGKFVNVPETGKFTSKFFARSLEFELECKSKQKKTVKYAYAVKLLPDEIVPEESKAKLKDGKIILHLKKLETRSWLQELQASGIDQHVDDEETDQKE